MKISIGQLRRLIRRVVVEAKTRADFEGMQGSSGSTHEMNVAKLVNSEKKFFIKFSSIAPDLWNDGDPDQSVQILSEYLAYCIMRLYPKVRSQTPEEIELLYDPEENRVGLATSEIKGKSALPSIDPKELAKQLEVGVYVNIMLGNYDAMGTGTGNLMIDKGGKVYQIDPGAAFNYRARGARPKGKFGPETKELNTMLDPKFNYGQGSGYVYQYANLVVAAKEFLSVPWDKISGEIRRVRAEVEGELKEHGMEELRRWWVKEVDSIQSVLQSRYQKVKSHADNIVEPDPDAWG